MDALCPECNDTEWVPCHFCSTDYCERCSRHYLIRCEGEGCNRANCNEVARRDCTIENEERQETVRPYTDGERFNTFCGDCYPGGMNVLGESRRRANDS